MCVAADSTTGEPAVWPSFRMKNQGEGKCERPKGPSQYGRTIREKRQRCLQTRGDPSGGCPVESLTKKYFCLPSLS